MNFINSLEPQMGSTMRPTMTSIHACRRAEKSEGSTAAYVARFHRCRPKVFLGQREKVRTREGKRLEMSQLTTTRSPRRRESSGSPFQTWNACSDGVRSSGIAWCCPMVGLLRASEAGTLWCGDRGGAGG